MPPKIGVVMVNYNNYGKYFEDLFASLKKSQYPNWEIVFVDNASTDGSVDYLKEKFAPQFSNLTIIQVDKNSGFATSNNIGLKYLQEKNFDYAYLLNLDTTVEPDFLERALQKAGEDVGSVQSLILLHPSVAPAGAAMQSNTLGNAIHYLGFGYCYGYGWAKERWEKYLTGWRARDPELNIAYGSGAGLLLNMRALREVGFFDDVYFMYHEDLDLGWRLRLAGYKNLLAPESIIYHKYEFSKSIKKYYWMERNRFITMMKDYSAWTLILIFLALLIMELGLLLFSFRSGWWREKLKVYEYFLYPKHWRRIFAERRRIQKLRKVSDRQIAKYLVGKILFQDMDNWVLRKIANPLFGLHWKIIKMLM